MSGRFDGRRVLVTQADLYVAPPIVRAFEREGAEVIADTTDYTVPGAVDDVVARAGHVDVLIANFAGPRRLLPMTNLLCEVTKTPDEDFQAFLDHLVWPTVRFVRAVLPRMIERRAGKIVGITSASPLRGIAGASVYTAARGAQNAFLCAVGSEVAGHNVQVNAIGPAFIHNNAYVTEEVLADAELRAQLDALSPAGAMGTGEDAAEMVLALAGEASNFLAGQMIPVAGGWVQ